MLLKYWAGYIDWELSQAAGDQWAVEWNRRAIEAAQKDCILVVFEIPKLGMYDAIPAIEFALHDHFSPKSDNDGTKQ